MMDEDKWERRYEQIKFVAGAIVVIVWFSIFFWLANNIYV